MAGDVSWEALDSEEPITFTFLGVTYDITPGSTEDKYIYWDPNFPTVFCTTNSNVVATAANNWLVCVNEDGIPYPTDLTTFISGAQLIPESVPTESIEQNAVSNSQHVYDASAIELPAGTPGAWTTIATIIMDLVGGDVHVSFSCNTDQVTNIRILRDVYKIWESPVNVAASYFSFQVLDESPPAGERTYYLQGRTDNSGSATDVAARSLTCIEYRK